MGTNQLGIPDFNKQFWTLYYTSSIERITGLTR
jgi:hypothetical protein